MRPTAILLVLGVLLVLLGVVFIGVALRSPRLAPSPPERPVSPGPPRGDRVIPELYRGALFITVPIGETREVKVPSGERMLIEFVDLLEDTRCPASVVCVWSGIARIQTRIFPSTPADVRQKLTVAEPVEFKIYGGSQAYALPSSPASQTNTYTPPALRPGVDQWSVVLVVLDPYPENPKDSVPPRSPKDIPYRATFAVMPTGEIPVSASWGDPPLDTEVDDP